MRLFYVSLVVVLIVGCTDTPELQTPKEVSAKKTISSNAQEAQEAQEAYLELQKTRG